MPKHADDDEVLVGYESSHNISFHGKDDELGITWGEWRKLSEEQRTEDVYVVDGE